ncbi:hypothetical protein AWC38_SpisGene1342 [Stylophora pistillata]|uniref:Uncharacterized protein n=1 Tax=Stylophora pistillata TaxID=50429 RepID=A0A2B4SV53_STYPI|nr:hypothetical protein AWC38_SpisGene1342 [Stylophora pistillata]
MGVAKGRGAHAHDSLALRPIRPGFYSSVSKKDNAIKELEERCLTFESRVFSLEQENDPLRLALTIIMQEKNEVENNQPKSSECWVHADESMRNEEDRTANNDDRSLRRPSCRPTDVTTQRTNQSVSTESTRKREQTQPNRQKKVMIAGDSVLKHLQGHKMARNSRVKVSSFTGCTTEDMHDFIKPVLRKKPDEIILHVGTNSLRSCDTPRACAEEIIDLATMYEATRSISTPPWMGCQSIAGLPPALNCRYPFIHLGEERHCESKVSCLRTQHNVPAGARTRTTGSGVERTNHEATAPSHDSKQRLNAQCEETDINIDDRTIRRADHTKSLGLTIDAQLSWSKRVDEICKKASSAIGALKRPGLGLYEWLFE